MRKSQFSFVTLKWEIVIFLFREKESVIDACGNNETKKLTDNTNRYKLQFIESVLTTVNDFFLIDDLNCGFNEKLDKRDREYFAFSH